MTADTDNRAALTSVALEGEELVSFDRDDARAVESPAPDSFGARYEHLRVLGAGGMGEVRLCRDRMIGRLVAMKVIRAPRRGSPQRWRFVREARVQGQLEHPSIVPVYDLGIDPDGFPYFTMQRVVGSSLDVVLAALREGDPEARRRFTRRRMLTRFSQLCLAVDYIHRRGVVHRDLKPSNVMLGEFGEVFLLDWGLAKLLDALEPESGETILDASNARTTSEGSVLGTPGYMAPEQLRGEIHRVGPRSDVYSLGTMLYELLTLAPMHPQELLPAKLISVLQTDGGRPRAIAPDVPDALDRLCTHATRLEPEARLPSAGALSSGIETHLNLFGA